MNTMIILRGLPGSGKTTIAHPRRPHVALSTDDYFKIGRYYHYHTQLAQIAHEWNQWRVECACRDRQKCIIVDNTNITWEEIEPYLIIAKEYRYRVEVLEPDTEWKEDVAECAKKTCHRVPRTVIQRMKDRWESTADIQTKIREFFK